MGVEMAMKAIGDIEIGQDLTPPLAPLSHALHDSFLHSHCSACFSPVVSPTRHHHHLHVSYCSPACSASDSPLHASSAELHFLQSTSTNCDLDEDTADLRAALRLLAAFPHAAAGGRVAGLLTNRDKLLTCRNYSNSENYSGEILGKIQNGGKVMAAARRAQNNGEVSEELKKADLEEAALCAVLVNAVEVVDNEGHSLGIAVYGIDFSWINHSCSPNAFYRFEFCSPNFGNLQSSCNSKMRIAASCAQIQMNAGFGNNGIIKGEGQAQYEPRVTLRSIRRIENGTEVTIAYTDLLQPMAMRQFDLQSKYHFTCSCTRCSAQPLTYVDQVLQDFCVVYDGIPKDTGNISFDEDAIKKLDDFMDDVVAEYLSDSNAESCCVKLEKLLTLSILEKQLRSEVGKKFKQKGILHPFHYLSMKAYITLASAYKIRAYHLDPISEHRLEAFDMLRISTAYSLLLAGATHHLFSSESSLTVSAANFWTNAGESLLALSRSSQWEWSGSMKSEFADSTQLSILQHNSCRCSLIDHTGVNHISCYSAYTNFLSRSSNFVKCSAYLSQNVWDFLARGCPYLQEIKDPINFNWLRTSRVSDTFSTSADLDTSPNSFEFMQSLSVYKREECNDQKKLLLYQLGIHCLHYGGLLSSICYGQDSYFTTHIRSILQREHGNTEQDLSNHATTLKNVSGADLSR